MKNCILVLDNIRSVANAGSIFRTAECLGVSKIVLIGTTPTPLDRFGRVRKDFAKVSLGAEKIMEWEYVKDGVETIKTLKQQNYKIISLEQAKNSVDVKSFEPGEPFVLIAGNEVEGVSEDLLKISDQCVEIEMCGVKESLNVSVAVGIALSHLIAC